VVSDYLARSLETKITNRSRVLVINEKIIQGWLKRNKYWVSLDGGRPDFWDGQFFIEIKRATTKPDLGFKIPSNLFPNLYFSRNVDEQIRHYPRPLKIIVYQAYSFPPIELAQAKFV
jgi:hypothetical protein